MHLGSNGIYDKVVIVLMNTAPGSQKSTMQEIQASLLPKIPAGFLLPPSRLLQVRYRHMRVIWQVPLLWELHCRVQLRKVSDVE